MTTSFDRVTLSVSERELRDLHYALGEKIEKAITTHWVNHPESFEASEGSSMEMLDRFCGLLGYPISDFGSGRLRKWLAEAVKAKEPT